ncbi:MAG: histone protein [Bacteriovoracales bacterium]|nr:histone protein [Bacteriovoracales bacterium]
MVKKKGTKKKSSSKKKVTKKKIRKKTVSKKKVLKKKAKSNKAKKKKATKKKGTKKKSSSKKKVTKKKIRKKTVSKKKVLKKKAKGNKTNKSKKKKATKKKAPKKTLSPSSQALSDVLSKLPKDKAIEKYRKEQKPDATSEELEDDGLSRTGDEDMDSEALIDEKESPQTPSEGPRQPEGSLLSDEYNTDDEPDDGEGDYAYGWGYEDALDDPESVHEQQGGLDEDEAYALGLDKE